jgi:Ca2+-binding EF-hand superfamily protein
MSSGTAAQLLANEKWCKKMQDYFVVLDRNKNGSLSQEDWAIMLEDHKKVAMMSADEEAKLRDVHLRLAAKLGATGPGVQVSRDQFLKAAAEFSSKKEENTPLVIEVNQAWFNAVDTNDDGTICLEEYTKILQASNMSAEVAKAVFDAIDTNNNGKIEVDELLAMSKNFWFSVDNVV